MQYCNFTPRQMRNIVTILHAHKILIGLLPDSKFERIWHIQSKLNRNGKPTILKEIKRINLLKSQYCHNITCRDNAFGLAVSQYPCGLARICYNITCGKCHNIVTTIVTNLHARLAELCIFEVISPLTVCHILTCRYCTILTCHIRSNIVTIFVAQFRWLLAY